MALKPVTVTQLNEYISRVLMTDPLLGNISVTGEISKKTADKQYMDMVKFHLDNPDVLLVYVPVEFGPEDDGERSIDPDFQLKIDFLIKNILDTSKIPYITVSGTVEERLAQINDALNNR